MKRNRMVNSITKRGLFERTGLSTADFILMLVGTIWAVVLVLTLVISFSKNSGEEAESKEPYYDTNGLA